MYIYRLTCMHIKNYKYKYYGLFMFECKGLKCKYIEYMLLIYVTGMKMGMETKRRHFVHTVSYGING